MHTHKHKHAALSLSLFEITFFPGEAKHLSNVLACEVKGFSRFSYNNVPQIMLVFELYTFEVFKIGTKMWIILRIIAVWLVIKASDEYIHIN